jgi:hypothetical protein
MSIPYDTKHQASSWVRDCATSIWIFCNWCATGARLRRLGCGLKFPAAPGQRIPSPWWPRLREIPGYDNRCRDQGPGPALTNGPTWQEHRGKAVIMLVAESTPHAANIIGAGIKGPRYCRLQHSGPTWQARRGQAGTGSQASSTWLRWTWMKLTKALAAMNRRTNRRTNRRLARRSLTPIISKSYPKLYPFISILFITFYILWLYPLITKKTYPYIPMYGYKYWIAWVKMWIEWGFKEDKKLWKCSPPIKIG